MESYKKPPLGVEPEFIWKERRAVELCHGIMRYVEAGKGFSPSALEWTKELSNLLESLSPTPESIWDKEISPKSCPVCGKTPVVNKEMTVSGRDGRSSEKWMIFCSGMPSHTVITNGCTYKQALHYWNRIP